MRHTTLVLNVVLVLLEATRMSVQTPVFYGGYINYDLEKVNGTSMYKAKVQVITGWELGTGPCGTNCKVNRIGTSTLDTRRLMGTVNFGNFTWDSTINRTTISGISLNDVVTNTMQEAVLDVSESEQWEQVIATCTLELNGTFELDINVDGNYWRDLTFQSHGSLPWHLQTHIRPSVRADTKQPNRAPKFLPKPFYRILMNKTTTIHFPVYDEDYDMVKCKMSEHIEAGSLHVPVVGTTVNTNCSVTIEASVRNHFTNDSWIAIPIMVRDYQKTSPDFAVSSSSLVFIVHVTTHIDGPQFVSPTEAANTKFILYIDSVFFMEVFAQSSDGVGISKFHALHLGNESITMSDIKADPEGRDTVRYVELRWTPSKDDIGQHMVCLTVTDSIEVTSNERRCFNLQVKERLSGEWQNPSIVPTECPYFVDFPNGSFSCPTDVFCTIPVFVNSKSGLEKILITENYLDTASLRLRRNVTHDGMMLYAMDLFFRHSANGGGHICLQAIDIQGCKSNDTCMNVVTFPPNPCLSSPCINSGVCEPHNDNSGLFKCNCPEPYFGQFCTRKKDVCPPGICNHGDCIDAGKVPLCACLQGYSSDTNGNACLTKTNNCSPNTCNSSAICVDSTSRSTCIEVPHNISTNSLPSCPSDCTNGGICTDGTCVCRLGYSAKDCSQGSRGNFSLQSDVKFIDPTPRIGSSIVCYSSHKSILSCYVDVYIATKSGTTPSVNIKPSPELASYTSSNCTATRNSVFGFNNVYKCSIDMKGNVTSVIERYLCVTASDSGVSETICWDLVFNHDVSIEKNDQVRFLNPTPLGGSSFSCVTNSTCHLLLYTSYNISCEQVQSPSSGVTVFNSSVANQQCVTEVAFQFERNGSADICFLSAPVNYQHRCYTVKVTSPLDHVCKNTTCQNDGACIAVDPNARKCICIEGFTGDKCEQGPCLERDNSCKNNGSCFVNNHLTTCVCKVGTSGEKCENEITGITDIDHTGRVPVFMGTSTIKYINCNKNVECGFSTTVSGILTGNTRPIEKGRVSSTLSNIVISIEEMPSRLGFHQAVISFLPSAVGVFDMCILTLNASRVNQDELCLSVLVEEGVRFQYGGKELPHFVLPSLPPDSKLECELGTVCHATFTAHPGSQHERDCIQPMLLKSDFVNTNIFSNCSLCVDGMNTNATCTLDVAFRPSVHTKAENEICIALIRTKTNDTGEDRCFNVTVRNASQIKDMTGCQRLQCSNGGFCDGHDPINPVCFCRQGYAGSTCSTPIPINTPTSNTSFFTGTNGGLPTGIQCRLLETCPFQFQVCGSFSFKVGLKTPDLAVGEPVLDQTTGHQCVSGTVNVTSSELGSHRFCIQSIQPGGLVEDELCPTIRITGGQSSPIDQNKPHFLPPTFDHGSVMSCTKGEDLHLKAYYTNGNSTGSINTCPTLKESSPQPVDGVYIFPVELSPNTCTSEIVYKVPPAAEAGSESKLCIKVTVPGKPGEERCIELRIVDAKHDNRPCKGVVCASNSVCVSDLQANSSSCVCTYGATGPNCSQSNTPNHLPGIENLPNTTADTPHFDGISTLPKHISCTAGKPCIISVPYQGVVSKPPVPGKCDFNASTSAVGPIAGSANSLLVNVTIPEGTYRCCYQTTSDGTSNGFNVDELCFSVKIEKEEQVQNKSDMMPIFLPPTPSEHSILMCQADITCHISVVSSLNNDSKCEQVLLCGDPIAGVHVFQTSVFSGKCITDVGYVTSLPSHRSEFCFKAGAQGEERRFEVEITTQTNFGFCQKLHCLNGGKCSSTETNATCKCISGYVGHACEVETTTSTTVASTTALNTTNSWASSTGLGGTPTETTPSTIVASTTALSATNSPSSSIDFGGTSTGINMSSTSVSLPTTLSPSSSNAVYENMSSNTKPGNTSSNTTHGDTFSNTTPGATSSNTISGNTSSSTTGNTLSNTTPGNTSSNTTRGTTSSNTTPGNTSSNTTPGITFSNTTPGNASTNTTPGNTPTNTTPGNTSTNTTPGNTYTNTAPGNTSTNTTPGNTSTNTTPGNTSSNTTPGNTSSNTTHGHTLSNTTHGNTSPISTNGNTPSNTTNANTSSNTTNANTASNQNNNHSYSNNTNQNGPTAQNLTSSTVPSVYFTSNEGEHTTSRDHNSHGSNHNGTPGRTLYYSKPPMFVDAKPKDVRCPVNTSCSIVLLVNGTSGTVPNVQNGRFSNGLKVNSIKTSLMSCQDEDCIYETKITFVPLAVGSFDYCAQTTYNDNVNADERCLKIISLNISNSERIMLMPPHNSTIECPERKPCHFVVETVKPNGRPCETTLNYSISSVDVMAASSNDTDVCKYNVVYHPESSQQAPTQICFKSDYDVTLGNTGCTNIEVSSARQTDSQKSPCSQVRCLNGGFCDSSSDTATCRCRQGFQGQTCSNEEKCSIGTVPSDVECSSEAPCEIHFLTTGGSTNVSLATTGILATVKLNQMAQSTVHATLTLTTPADNLQVCYSIYVQGTSDSISCSAHRCTTIRIKPSKPSEPGSIISQTSVIDCSSKPGSTDCQPIVIASKPLPNGICPQLIVHPDTTVEGVHVFDNKLVNAELCVATVVTSLGNQDKQKLCLMSETNDVKCLNTRSSTSECKVKEVVEHARNMVTAGRTSCTCKVNGKYFRVIKNKPVVQKQELFKSAGAGAGGMAGTMVIGVVIYMVITKMKKKAQVTNLVERGVFNPPPKVRPPSAAKVFPTRAMLNRPPPPKNTDF